MKPDKPNISADLEYIFGFENGAHVVERMVASRDRIRAAYEQLFSGYGKKAEDVLNEVVHVENYPGIVTMRDINFYTFCEHHFLPFFGKADVSYQPGNIITGLGKLIRLVTDVHARRLQIQELMARDIASDLERVLGAKGTFVSLRAKHLCTCSRGPSDDQAWTLVTYGTGSLAHLAVNSTAADPAG